MLGYVNPHALAETWKSGEVHFSRSRNQLGKGRDERACAAAEADAVDCDADALLLLVEPVGPGVCHEGYRSCFFRWGGGGAVSGWICANHRGESFSSEQFMGDGRRNEPAEAGIQKGSLQDATIDLMSRAGWIDCAEFAELCADD